MLRTDFRIRGSSSLRPQTRAPRLTWLSLAGLLAGIVPAAGQPAEPPTTQSGSLSLLDAVRLTLTLQPEIRIAEQQVLWNRSLVQQARGQFDLTLQAGLSQHGDAVSISPLAQLIYPTSVPSLITHTTNYYIGASQQFRWGMAASVSIQYNRIDQSALPAPYGQSVLVFSVAQPLLRGRGAESTAAAETAAKVQQEASQLQLRHVIAQRIRDVCLAYWSYAAAHQSVSRWTEAEERARSLMHDEQRLVELGQHPPSNLKLLAANLAELTAARADAQRLLLEARQALGLAVGLSFDKTLNLGAPSSDFVSVPASRIPSAGQLAPLIQAAWSRRADLLAASTSVGAAQVQSRAAQRATEPRLDAQVDLGYAGLAEGTGAAPFFTAPYQGVAGLNFFVGLNLQYPVQNNAARGLVGQRSAEQTQAVLVRDNLRRQVGSAVAVLSASLQAAVLTLEGSEAAVTAYQGAVDDERKKVRAGLSTIFDLVQVQSRLNTAAQNSLAAHARVAGLIAQARFECGMLLAPQGAQEVIDLDQLTTFPQAPAATP